MFFLNMFGSFSNIDYTNYKNNVGIGYKFNFKDPFSFREIDFSISYTPDSWTNGLASNDPSSGGLDKDERIHSSFNFYHTLILI